MERFIADLIAAFESGQFSRRQFCETIALAASVYAAGETGANAAPAQGFKPIAINHISYACGDYRKARDFYASVLGTALVPKSDNGREARLMFGPEPGKGGGFLIPRNGTVVPRAKAIVDQISYTLTDGNEAKLRDALLAGGLEVNSQAGKLQFRDPFNYGVELVADAKSASAAAPKVAQVHHISFACPNVRQTSDWYAKFFNLEPMVSLEGDIVLPFATAPNGMAPSYLVMHGKETGAASAGGGQRKSRALVNHIAYTIADFDQKRVRAELKRMGYANPREDGPHSFHVVDVNGFDVQISGIEMTALGG